jgi:uncharacterized membrane protein YfcA
MTMFFKDKLKNYDFKSGLATGAAVTIPFVVGFIFLQLIPKGLSPSYAIYFMYFAFYGLFHDLRNNQERYNALGFCLSLNAVIFAGFVFYAGILESLVYCFVATFSFFGGCFIGTFKVWFRKWLDVKFGFTHADSKEGT